MTKHFMKLINNERTSVRILSKKGNSYCGNGATDYCEFDDAAHCENYAYDVCTKDYAACMNGADDTCYIDRSSNCYVPGAEDNA